ncbi:uncharacterized protein J3R85_005191 [Psidium guajava]|nr:uncharacterized protein J3R85_005191 [Psidium guajava]
MASAFSSIGLMLRIIPSSLTNPLTKQILRLPRAPNLQPSSLVYGFGFDHSANTHKMVQIDAIHYGEGTGTYMETDYLYTSLMKLRELKLISEKVKVQRRGGKSPRWFAGGAIKPRRRGKIATWRIDPTDEAKLSIVYGIA